METIKYNSGRGGARKGAGRPKGILKPIKDPARRRHTIGVRLPGHMVEWLKSHPEAAGRLIEKALKNTFNL